MTRTILILFLAVLTMSCGDFMGELDATYPVAGSAEEDDLTIEHGPFDLFDEVVELPYENVDGRAIFEGDIDLGPVPEDGLKALRAAAKSRRWPNNTIPYNLPSSLSSKIKLVALDGIREWNQKTNFKFVPWNGRDRNFISFADSERDGYCQAPFGFKNSGVHFVFLAPNGVPCAVHELGHVVGLFHTQSRSDRDKYIDIFYENIQTHAHRWYNIEYRHGSKDIGAYDTRSVMHYDSYTFAKPNSGPTMLTKSGAVIRPSRELTSTDIRNLRLIDGTPRGEFSLGQYQNGKMRIRGFAYDSDAGRSINVKISISGSDQENRSFRWRADHPRKVIEGIRVGWDIDIPVKRGGYKICVDAENERGGANQNLGCRIGRTAEPPMTGQDPVGVWSPSVADNGNFWAAGWALDPDTDNPIRVDIYVNGDKIGSTLAKIPRTDITEKYPTHGPNHGMWEKFRAPNGSRVCAHAVNYGGGSNKFLGCKTL